MTNVSTATIAAAMTSPPPHSPTTPASTTVTSTDGNSAVTTQSGNTSRSSAALNTDFETFLKMLTAQAKNQDPLNPIDSSDYATQLATFSSVEQQVRTNDLLSSLNTQFGSMGMSQMAHWIGMEARVSAPAQFTGTAIEIFPEFDRLADAATLVVTDQNEREVQRLTIDPEQDTISWAGQDDDGQSFPVGLYSFSVESHAAGSLLQTLPAQVYSRVEEIQNQSGTISLLLAGGPRVGTDEVSALRNP